MSKGLLYAFISVLFWSTLGVSLKLSVSALDDFSVAFFIGAITCVAIAIIIFAQKEADQIMPQLRLHYKHFIVAGVVGLGVQQLLYMIGYTLLPASMVVIVLYTYPLMIVILGILFAKETVSWQKIAALLAGFVGVAIIVTKGSMSTFVLSAGIIVVFGAAASFAIFSFMIKRSKASTSIAMFWYSVFGFLFLAACLVKYPLHFPTTFSTWLGIMYVSIFPTAIAFILWNRALQLLPSSICSAIALLTPVLSLVILSIVLKDTLVLIQYIGFAVVLASIAYTIFSKK